MTVSMGKKYVTRNGDMKSYHEIKSLRANAQNFESFWAEYYNHVTRPNVYDHNATFEKTERHFENFKIVAFFNSYTQYRDSPPKQLYQFDYDLAQEYMVRAMNCLRKELFAKCAELMKADAAKKVEAARAELKTMQETLDDILVGAVND